MSGRLQVNYNEWITPARFLNNYSYLIFVLMYIVLSIQLSVIVLLFVLFFTRDYLTCSFSVLLIIASCV